jgi:transcriptional regulator of heat shock response
MGVPHYVASPRLVRCKGRLRLARKPVRRQLEVHYQNIAQVFAEILSSTGTNNVTTVPKIMTTPTTGVRRNANMVRFVVMACSMAMKNVTSDHRTMPYTASKTAVQGRVTFRTIVGTVSSIHLSTNIATSVRCRPRAGAVIRIACPILGNKTRILRFITEPFARRKSPIGSRTPIARYSI